jgi:6-phosphogluconolactonase (cycloisomerase 2 family)
MQRVTHSLIAAVLAIGAAAPAIYAAQPAAATDTVFVMTNDADQNEVIAYQRSYDGSFHESNRYATGGRGTGGVNDPLEAQGSLTLSPDHSLLFAVNAGSGTLSVFSVHQSTLFLADKVATGGSQPVSVAQWQNLVYVLNSGGAGSVTGFRLANNGRLQPIKNATVFLSANATGGASLSISPNGQFVAVVERLANAIDTFHINSDGTLGALVSTPSPGAGAFSGRFAPDGKLIVSETGPAVGTNASAVSSYSILANGKISAISQSVPTFGSANCWNAFTPGGTIVYVSNAGTSNLSGFTLGQSGALTPLADTIVGSNPEGSTNLDIAVSGDGKYLFTLNDALGTIGVFAIQKDGTLTSDSEITGLPKATGFNGIAAL